MYVGQVPKTEQMPDLLLTADIAQLANVNVATVNRWVRQGRLPVAMQGPGPTGARMFRRADVDALLSSARTTIRLSA